MATKTPIITDEEIAALDPDAMSAEDRISFITDARTRRSNGEMLTNDHLRFAIRCMKSERKASAAAAGTKKKAPVQATSLNEF